MKPAVPDPPEISYELWKDFTPGDIGFDVGSNCGQTLPMMRELCQMVYAFEPAEECQPYLRDHPSATAYFQMAISDRLGTVELAAVDDKISTGQLVTAGMSGMEWRSDDPTVKLRTVLSSTLDDVAEQLGHPDLIKVDVEGHEDKVLNGAAGILAAWKTQWLIEFHSPGLHQYCVSLLRTHGYKVTTVRHPHYPPDSPLWKQHGWIKALPRA